MEDFSCRISAYFSLLVGSLVALFVIFVLIYKSFYRKAPPDSALVVSGGRKKRVVFGGSLINPITNTTQLISLNTMQLPGGTHWASGVDYAR